jgi:hypothetical protein
MLDVRVGAWAGLDTGDVRDSAALAAALKAVAVALAASSPKKGGGGGGARRKKAGSGGGGSGEEAGSVPTAPALDPAAPAVRALAYRMPPDWGDGWMTKRAGVVAL